jgi:hypothetical protein
MYAEINFFYAQKWRNRWKKGKKGARSRAILPEPNRKATESHWRLKKPESALLTQLRTGETGFNHFLYKRRVLGVESSACDCAQGDMTVEHVLLKCHKWQTERAELIGSLRTRNLRQILTERKSCRAAVKMIQRTKLLKQFKATIGMERDRAEEEEK